MKTVRVIGVVILFVGAILAAYFSYSQTLGKPVIAVSSRGGPPAGFSMPGGGGGAPGGGATAPAGKRPHSPANGAHESKTDVKKGEPSKN